MKRLHVSMVAVVAILLGAASCKTTEKVEIKTENNVQVSQVKLQDMRALDEDLLQGKWIITTAMGKTIVADETAHIIIDVKNKRVYGNNGCNTFNGSLVLSEHCNISFTDCVTTLIACRPEVTDANIMQALGRTTYYNTTHNGHDSISIDLLDSTGSTVATLSRDMHEMLNGYWEIAEVDGMKIKLDEMPTIVIDIEEQKFTGNSGCNIMNGSLVCNTNTTDNKIAFTGIASTRRMCTPDAMEVEDKVLDAINKVESFRILDNNRIALYNHTSQYALMILEKK